jgi:hypothetical protein
MFSPASLVATDVSLVRWNGGGGGLQGLTMILHTRLVTPPVLSLVGGRWKLLRLCYTNWHCQSFSAQFHYRLLHPKKSKRIVNWHGQNFSPCTLKFHMRSLYV